MFNTNYKMAHLYLDIENILIFVLYHDVDTN